MLTKNLRQIALIMGLAGCLLPLFSVAVAQRSHQPIPENPCSALVAEAANCEGDQRHCMFPKSTTPSNE